MTDSIAVDPDLADTYRAASDEDRRKLDLVLNLRLRDVTRTGSPSTMSWLRSHEMRGHVA